jgi:hypothetical protein
MKTLGHVLTVRALDARVPCGNPKPSTLNVQQGVLGVGGEEAGVVRRKQKTGGERAGHAPSP